MHVMTASEFITQDLCMKSVCMQGCMCCSVFDVGMSYNVVLY